MKRNIPNAESSGNQSDCNPPKMTVEPYQARAHPVPQNRIQATPAEMMTEITRLQQLNAHLAASEREIRERADTQADRISYLELSFKSLAGIKEAVVKENNKLKANAASESEALKQTALLKCSVDNMRMRMQHFETMVHQQKMSIMQASQMMSGYGTCEKLIQDQQKLNQEFAQAIKTLQSKAIQQGVLPNLEMLHTSIPFLPRHVQVKQEPGENIFLPPTSYGTTPEELPAIHNNAGFSATSVLQQLLNSNEQIRVPAIDPVSIQMFPKQQPGSAMQPILNQSGHMGWPFLFRPIPIKPNQHNPTVMFPTPLTLPASVPAPVPAPIPAAVPVPGLNNAYLQRLSKEQMEQMLQTGGNLPGVALLRPPQYQQKD